MKKRLLIGLMAGGLMAAMLPGVASADPPTKPLGGCPAGDWRLEYFPSDTKTDRNGDGYVCHKDVNGVGNDPVNDGTTYNHKDNNNPLLKKIKPI